MPIVGLTCCPERAAKYEDIKRVVKRACGPLKGILNCTEGQAIARDFNSGTLPPLVVGGTALNDHFAKLIFADMTMNSATETELWTS